MVKFWVGKKTKKERTKMSKKITSVCFACGKVGHLAMVYRDPWKAFLCPMKPNPSHWGKTGVRLDNGHCSECDCAGFSYNNGNEFSVDGVRGYRCLECGAIKPERS